MFQWVMSILALEDQFQGTGNASKQKVVNKLLVIPGQKSEFVWEGKRRHEILNRQKLGLLPIQPKGGFMILALWAAAVSTGSGSPFRMTAVGALHEQFPGLRCPTSLDRVDSAQMTGQKPGAVFSL